MYSKLLTFFLIFVFLIQNFIYADEIDLESFSLDSLETSNSASNVPVTNSKHIIVIERTTETILFEKNGFSKTPMASTTKIMTAIVAIENSNLSDEVTISKKAANTGGSCLGITENSKISLNNLLLGLLMRSGNDCAVAIAEYISGDIQSFAKLMNQKAKEIGLENTNFVTPHGLDAENHYTTAYDLAILTNYALRNETFKNIVKNKTATITIDGQSRQIINTHELLGYLDGVYGVKTGFTGNAGRCLVTSCVRNNLDIIIVVLGAETKKIRTQDTVNIINYIFNNFEMVNTMDFLFSNFNIKEINVQNSFKKAKIYLEKSQNYIYPVKKDSKKFEIKSYILNNQIAPLNKDSKIGVVKFLINGNYLYENNILIEESIDSISQFEYFKYIIKLIHNQFY